MARDTPETIHDVRTRFWALFIAAILFAAVVVGLVGRFVWEFLKALGG